jgi:hypothetical protein
MLNDRERNSKAQDASWSQFLERSLNALLKTTNWSSRFQSVVELLFTSSPQKDSDFVMSKGRKRPKLGIEDTVASVVVVRTEAKQSHSVLCG